MRPVCTLYLRGGHRIRVRGSANDILEALEPVPGNQFFRFVDDDAELVVIRTRDIVVVRPGVWG